MAHRSGGCLAIAFGVEQLGSQEHGVSWQALDALGHRRPGRGDLEVGEAPLYRVSLLTPYLPNGLSAELTQELYGAIFQRLEANGGRVVVGCRTVEEQWSSFFVEAWPGFDALAAHVAAMRELQARYGVQWQAESYIGVKAQ